MALDMDHRDRDPHTLACLGRVWLFRGRQEKSIKAMRSALEYSEKVSYFIKYIFPKAAMQLNYVILTAGPRPEPRPVALQV